MVLLSRFGQVSVVTDTYDYDAFGNLISRFGTTPNNYLYSGERFDSDLGAYHLRERYYNPQRGRFLTIDPFAGFTDLPRTLHKYLYVGADPVNYIDPNGLTETTEYHLNVTRLPCIAMRIEGPLRFAQIMASPEFSAAGDFAGRTIGEVAAALRSGALSPSQVPVRIIEREGTRLIVNTRSSLALTRAGIPQRLWNLINSTGDRDIEKAITKRLLRNGLTSKGTDALRITGLGKQASCLR